RPHDGKYVGPISVDYYLDFGRVLLEFAPPASALSARTHQNCRTHEEQEAFLTPRIGYFRPHLGRPRLVRSRSEHDARRHGNEPRDLRFAHADALDLRRDRGRRLWRDGL